MSALGYECGKGYPAPEEVHSLARAPSCERDAALFLTAAFAGLRRGELVALRWRDVDFARETIRVTASYSSGALTSPKSGKVRSVPMVPQVAEALARLANGSDATDDELVFPGVRGEYLDGPALRRRYKLAVKRAGLRRLRFHDLRHVFGSLAIDRASIVQVQHWMGHADVKTTMRYLHHKSRAGDAALLAEAFAVEQPRRPGRPRAEGSGSGAIIAECPIENRGIPCLKSLLAETRTALCTELRPHSGLRDPPSRPRSGYPRSR